MTQGEKRKGERNKDNSFSSALSLSLFLSLDISLSGLLCTLRRSSRLCRWCLWRTTLLSGRTCWRTMRRAKRPERGSSQKRAAERRSKERVCVEGMCVMESMCVVCERRKKGASRDKTKSKQHNKRRGRENLGTTGG